MGRKTGYDKSMCDKAYELASKGLSDKKIAKSLQVGLTAFYDYKNKFPEFSEAIKKGKKPANSEVEAALFKKCTGFIVKVQKAFKVKNIEYSESGKKISETEEVVLVEEDQYIPPDTTAQIFFLKNRESEEWKDKREAENDNKNDNEIIITEVE